MAKHYLEQVIGRSIGGPETDIMSLRVPFAGTLEKVTMLVDQNVSSTNTFDAHKNGTTVFSNQADRPSITSGNQSDEAAPTSTTTVAVGDKLTVDADVINEALDFVTAVFQIEDGMPDVNAQTGTSYSLQASDNGKIVTLNNASAVTVTVPSGLGAKFNCLLVQLGTGQVTLSPSSTTLNNASGLKTRARYSMVTIYAYSANTLVVGGDTTP